MPDADAIARRTRGDLLERETELAALSAAVASAAAGDGGVVVVEGPGGIGKSRLLGAARELGAGARLRVLSARCSELERSFPFGAVRQLFEPLLLSAGEERTELFGGAAALAAPLFDNAAAGEGDDALFSRLHGLYWLAANVAATQPIALVVDDAHWADEASIRFLTFLAHRIADIPAVLIVGSRPVDDPTADPAIGALLTDPEARHLRPAPLSQGAVAALLGDRAEGAPDPAFVAACVDATGGNPFLLRELAGAIAAEGLAPKADAADRVRSIGPSGIATVLLLRLRRLSPAAIDLARALAILGDGVDVRSAGAFAGLSEDDALEGARVLETAGVADCSEGLRFVHPIVRQSVYQDMTSVERGEGHAAAAAFVAGHGGPPDAVAAHLLHAPPRGDAGTVATLRTAAARSEALGDPIAAADQLRRALAEPPPTDQRAEVLLALGGATARAGLTEAAGHLEACLTLDPPPATRVAASGFLAELRQFSGRPDLATDVLEQGIAKLGEDTSEGRLLAAHLVGPAHVGIKARRRILPRIRGFVDPGGPARSGEDFVVLAALAADAIMDHNDGRAAADLALRALAAPLPANPDPAIRAAFTVVCVSLMAAEEHDAADRALTALIEGSRAAGARAAAVGLTSVRALTRYRRGTVATAEADALEALEGLPEAHGAEMLAHAGAATAVLAGLERDRPRAALDAILDETPYHRDPDILPYSQILLARGALHQAYGEHDVALTFFEACHREDAPGWGTDTPALIWWRSSAAVSLAALGRADEARAVAAEEVALARASGLPRATGLAERVAALVGPEDERAAGLTAAVATLEATDAPLELARALADLGGELRRTGDRGGARGALGRAHEIAERIGATRTARIVRQELRTLGARPQPTPGQGLDALTPAERRVADLAASGRTNRDIAQSLFLSEKTVETHLAKVFRKLGVRSRRQLPELLPTGG